MIIAYELSDSNNPLGIGHEKHNNVEKPEINTDCPTIISSAVSTGTTLIIGGKTKNR